MSNFMTDDFNCVVDMNPCGTMFALHDVSPAMAKQEPRSYAVGRVPTATA